MSSNQPIKAIILAAGKGTRMKSSLLKVAHTVAGKPIVNYVLDAVEGAGSEQTFLVIGHQSEHLKAMTNRQNVHHVLQDQQLGTGHAVMQVIPQLSEAPALVLVLAGDCPLIEEGTLKNLITTHLESNAEGTILTTKMSDPGSYGRILRGKTGVTLGIKEAKDCTKEQLNIKEINTGVYCFNQSSLINALGKLTTDNAQNEYYLTDVIHILREEKKHIEAYCIDDADQAVGVNTRQDLAKINKILFAKKNQSLMSEGVTLIDPDTTYIDTHVEVGTDTVIHPLTVIEGNSKIGQHCEIGPFVHLKDAIIADGEVVRKASDDSAVS